MEQLKKQVCRIKINLASNAYFCWCFVLCLFLLFVAFITFSEVSNGESHKILAPCAAQIQPCLIQSFGISESSVCTSWHCPGFTPGISALHPVFLPPAPHPLRHRPHQEERKGELSELHKNSNARFGNCLLEFGKLKETRNAWNIRLFQSFNLPETWEKKNAPNFEIVFRRTAKIGAFLLEVSVGQVSEPSEFSCFLKEADRLLHWTSKW